MNRKSYLLLGCAFYMATAAIAQSQPGTLDPGFGTGGKVFTSFGMDATARELTRRKRTQWRS